MFFICNNNNNDDDDDDDNDDNNNNNNADDNLFTTEQKFTKDLPITKQCRILTHLRYIAMENIVRKGKIACDKKTSNFSFFSRTFSILYGT